MNPYVVSSPNLLCASLRRRDPWAGVAAQLLQSTEWRGTESAAKQAAGTNSPQEEHLERYDLALAIPQRQQTDSQLFRILLLTAADVGLPETTQRIGVFSSLGGWKSTAVIFLAAEDDSSEATRALAELQVEYATSDATVCGLQLTVQQHRIMGKLPALRIIPITFPEALPTTIETVVASLTSSTLSHPRPLDLVQGLLPYCAVDKPLARRTAETLAGTGMSLKELVCEMATEEGRLGIGTVIDEEEAARFISFWTYEFPLD